MTSTAKSFKRAVVGLLIVNVVTLGTMVVCLLTARRALEHGEDALVALADDVTRLSQAQVAAERMVTVGRAYLLTYEPELLARAQAAEAKMTRLVRTVVSSAADGEDRRQLDSLVASAKRYREAFRALVSGEKAPGEPRDVAASLRRHVIPAREEVIADLDALAARRLREIEVRRSAAHVRRARAVNLMYAVGVPGTLAGVILVWLAVGRARTLIAARFAATASLSQLPGRSTSAHRLSRRVLSVRPRP